MKPESIVLETASCGNGRKYETGNVPEAALRRFNKLRGDLAPLRDALLNHHIYNEVDSLGRLREFMQIHVFAVWDFMSLVKRLQRELTCTSLPWTPPTRARIARFANEVVLGEESDLGLDGKPLSHFELYLRAMDEIGADTSVISRFMAQINDGRHYAEVLEQMSVPPGVADFVKETLHCAIHGSVTEAAAFFLFGREDVIPEMFERLLKLWHNGKAEVPHFAYYLQRHIELDGASHGPWAREMLTALAGQNARNWERAASAARQAVSARIRLWNRAAAHLENQPRR